MTTIQQAMLFAKQQLLAQSNADEAAFEAQLLLSHVLQRSRSHLLTWPEKEISEKQFSTLQLLIQRRMQGEPVAYLTGVKEFWSLKLQVTSATLIPRPETELLVETILRLLPQQVAQVADLGTGSGAIALALATEHPDWEIHATDSSLEALQVAKANAQHLQCKNIQFFQGDWCQALPGIKYDAILSNPPYIAESEWTAYASGLAFEPRSALVSGQDGLQAIRVLSNQAKDYVKSHGFLLIEHGFEQGAAVREILLKNEYINVCTICDLAGLDRLTVGQVP